MAIIYLCTNETKYRKYRFKINKKKNVNFNFGLENFKFQINENSLTFVLILLKLLTGLVFAISGNKTKSIDRNHFGNNRNFNFVPNVSD